MKLDENLLVELVERGVVNDTFRRLSSLKKERLYRAALALFGEFGFDGLSVDQYCAETEISKGSFFQYFPSKTHLLEFAVLAFDIQLADRIAEIMEDEPVGSTKARLNHLYISLVTNSDLRSEESRFYLFVTRASAHSAVAIEGVDLQRHVRSYVINILEEGMSARQIRRGLNLWITADVITSLLGSILSQHTSDSAAIRHLTSDQFVSLLLNGIGE